MLSPSEHSVGTREANSHDDLAGHPVISALPSESSFSVLPLDIYSGRILEKLMPEDLLALASAGQSFNKANWSEPLWRLLFRSCVDAASFLLHLRIDPPPDDAQEACKHWRDSLRAASKGRLRAEGSVSEQPLTHSASFQLTMAQPLLRVSNHAAVVIGECILLIGGWRPLGHPDSCVVVLNINNLEVYEAELSADSIRPRPRRCHTACTIAPAPGSDIERVLLLGGRGEEHHNPIIYDAQFAMVLELLDPEAKTVRWRAHRLAGEGPGQDAGIFHHVMNEFDGGKKVVVWGGETMDVTETDDAFRESAKAECANRADSAFVLDVLRWKWVRVPTGGDLPGHRSLARSVVYNHKMVVVGGTLDPQSPWSLVCGNLAPMTPYALDLRTWIWQRGPEGAQPPSRTSFVAERHGDYLIGGGGNSAGNAPSLDDGFRLDLRTLRWSNWATGLSTSFTFQDACTGAMCSGVITGGYACCLAPHASARAQVFIYARSGRYAGGLARLKNLHSSASLNGAVGRLTTWVWEKRRWCIKLHDDHVDQGGQRMLVMPENIQSLPDPADAPLD